MANTVGAESTGAPFWVELDLLPPRTGDILVCRGFSEAFERGVLSGHPAEFRVEGPVLRPDGERWQLTEGQAVAGMSGSPLVNVRTGRLAGLLTRSRDTQTDLGGWTVHTLAGLAADTGFEPLLRGVVGAARRRNAEVEERWLEAGGFRGLLAAPYRELPTRRTPATLLVARYGVVPFHPARQPAVDELLSWCFDKGGSLTRLIVGPAGSGKTRLAAELAFQLAKHSWLTGFWSGARDSCAAVEWISTRGDPVLMVVDYAETRPDLPALLAAVGRLEKRGHTVRVLLLARAVGEWWPALGHGHAHPEDVRTTLVGTQVVTLKQLADLVDDPADALRTAAAAIATRQGMSPPQDTDLPSFAAGTVWSYLLVHMVALETVGTPDQHGRPTAFDVLQRPDQVLAFAIDRERGYWRNAADAVRLAHVSGIVLDRVVLALSLLGAANETDAAATLIRVPDLADANTEHRRALARWMHDLYPPLDPGDGWTSGLQPDLLSEANIADHIANASDVAVPLLVDLRPAQASRALAALARAARRRSEVREVVRVALVADLIHLGEPAISVAARTGPWLARVLSEALDLVGGPIAVNLMRRLIEALPRRTVVLRDVAVRLTAHDVARCRLESSSEALAFSLNDHSVRLSEVGLFSEAREAVIEAIGLRRSGQDGDPQARLIELAESLVNLGEYQAGLGQYQHALDAVDDAIGILNGLKAEQSEDLVPRLAISLGNRSNHLINLGRQHEALSAAEDAVALWRTPSVKVSLLSKASLARSLNNVSNRYMNIGSLGNAVATSREAVRINRELAARHPDAFNLDLAHSVRSLSGHLANTGHLDEALTAAGESVELYRDLAALVPDVFNLEFAHSLNSLSNCYANLGRQYASLSAIQEAVTIFQETAESQPEVLSGDLAGSLINLANGLVAVGQIDQAVRTAQDCVARFRLLAISRPAIFTPDLASALHTLSDVLFAANHSDEALATIQEAVALRRSLAAQLPAVFNKQLAGSLVNLSNRLALVRHWEAAATASEEAVALLQSDYAVNPRSTAVHLAKALISWSRCLLACYRLDPALVAAEKSVEVLDDLTIEYPELFVALQVSAMDRLASVLYRLDRYSDVIRVRQAISDLQG